MELPEIETAPRPGNIRSDGRFRYVWVRFTPREPSLRLPRLGKHLYAFGKHYRAVILYAYREGASAVKKDDMILISVDDHVIEPLDMFKNHLPKKYADETLSQHTEARGGDLRAQLDAASAAQR